MALTITERKITSDRVPSVYALHADHPDRWHIFGLSGFAGGHFTRAQAIAALVLAEYVTFHHGTSELRIVGTPTTALCCLYCGGTDDIFEVLITIDERTSEYALQCGLCDGVWAQ